MPAPTTANPLTPLFRGAVGGDMRARDALVARVRPLIERQLLRYPLSPEDREDVTQSTLLQIARKLDSFRGDARFSTWLFRVTANEALMLMRSQRRHRARVMPGVDPVEVQEKRHVTAPWEHAVAVRARDAAIRTAIETLPEATRAVVVARYDRGLSLQAVAHRMQITEAAARARLNRARKLLRARFGEVPALEEARAELAA